MSNAERATMTAIESVPEELKEIPQWTFTRSANNKAPKDTKYEPEGGKTFDEVATAIRNSKGVLKAIFYATPEDAYVLGDYDHINIEDIFAELPPDLGFLLKTVPTYIEASRSGEGIRFVYKLESADVKKQLTGHSFEGSEVAMSRESAWSHVCIHKPGMTFTGKKLPFSTDTIATVTLEQLGKIYNLKYKKDTLKVVKGSALKAKSSRLPSVPTMIKWLFELPLNANPRIQRAYLKTFKDEKVYDHYKYWTKVMASLKEYSGHLTNDVEVLQAFIDWSAQDTEHFEGIDNVQKHWASFKKSEGPILTFKTIKSLLQNYRIKWAIPKAQSKEARDAGVPRQPMIAVYANFKQALDHYSIKIIGNELEHFVYYLTGDCDILDEHFRIPKVKKHFDRYYGPFTENDLISLFTIFLQANDFVGISNGAVRNHLANYTIRTGNMLNLFTKYIDTPFDKLPKDYKDNPEYYDVSSLNKVWECLTIDYVLTEEYRKKEDELYRSYLKKWFMGILRGQYYEGRFKRNNCILILSGKESQNKSSFFDLALPPFFSHLIGSPGHGFATPTDQRDLSKLACEHLILAWDDSINRHINAADADMFKAVIENKENAFIDKWDKNKTRVSPIAIYGATSNKREFKMSDEGNRRFFIIPVKKVNTVELLKICWHPIFNQLKQYMLKNITEESSPWLLTQEEIRFQLFLHKKFKAVNSIDLILEDLYDTSHKFRMTSQGDMVGVTDFRRDHTGRLKTLQTIVTDINRANIDTLRLTQNRAALRAALKRFCSAYTNTQGRSICCTRPKGIITNGIFETAEGRKKYVMPPLAADIDVEDLEYDEDDLT